MIYLKTMKWSKKFWIVFFSFLPFASGAVAPLLILGIAGIGAVAGFSIYRSMAPVDMTETLKFFSSCWSCQMFSDIMATISNILPHIYSAVGHAIIPVAIMLTAIWFTWQLLTQYINSTSQKSWDMASSFGVQVFKLGLVCILLAMPLPKFISDVAITPIFNVGLSLNRMAVHDDTFDTCVVTAAIVDKTSISAEAANSGVFSPKLRHNLACELGGVHQMTGLGMTVGWTMVNMAFDAEYMHKILWTIPFFPNVLLLFAGALVLVLFFLALVPIPVYFLEIFIKLALDLVMLPLMLLGWLFKDWKISLKGAGKSIRKIIDDVISGTLGIAMTGVFVSFAIMFLHAVFGDSNGASTLATAIEKNDSKFLMDALMMNNDSLITVVLMGLFLAMFMSMIPALIKTLFNVEISTDFYDKIKTNSKIVWEGAKKYYKSLKK